VIFRYLKCSRQLPYIWQTVSVRIGNLARFRLESKDEFPKIQIFLSKLD